MYLVALLLALFVGWYLWKGGLKKRVSAVGMDELEARRILELALDAGQDEIIAAHRRIIARVHPDKGGSAELARRVNMARDLLLARLRERNTAVSG